MQSFTAHMLEAAPYVNQCARSQMSGFTASTKLEPAIRTTLLYAADLYMLAFESLLV